jgi:diaminopimelate decarboxylase
MSSLEPKKKLYERPLIQRLNAGLMGKFGVQVDAESTEEIDGHSVTELLKTHGSPLFVLSESHIRRTYQDALRAFTTRYPKVQLAWSYKTNYLTAVCHLYHQLGAWAEVVSAFEYQKAIENGVSADKIIFNGPDKKEEDLLIAVTGGSLIHIDHLDELQTLIAICKTKKLKAKVAIRVNMETGIYPVWDRFGFNLESGDAWDAIQTIQQEACLELKGLHCHIGTFVVSPNAYQIAARKLSELALRITKDYAIHLDYLDLGGGFASKNNLKGAYLPGIDVNPGFEKYADAICSALLEAGFDKDQLPTLILETGRALIDDAAYLLGSVLSHKRLGDGRKATIVDFGVNILFTSFWYDHRITAVAQPSTLREDTILYGPLCMNIDVVREHISLPPLKKGDALVVHSVGAYNMTQWMQFITLRPAVVMIDPQEKVHLIRERETTTMVSAPEKLPQHLKEFKL